MNDARDDEHPHVPDWLNDDDAAAAPIDATPEKNGKSLSDTGRWDTDTSRRDDGREIEWPKIEQEYRAGQLSISELSRVFGVSRAAIQKRAKKHGWARDLREQVHNRAREMLIRDAASAPPVAATAVAPAVAPPATSDEPQDKDAADPQNVIEIAADRVVAIVREHRTGIRRSRELVNELLDELGAMSMAPGDLEDFAEIVAEVMVGLRDRETLDKVSFTEMDPAEWNRRQARFEKAYNNFLKLVGLASRAQTIQKLADSLQKLVTLERQAFDMDVDPDGKKGGADHIPVEERLKRYREDRERIAIDASKGKVVSIHDRSPTDRTELPNREV